MSGPRKFATEYRVLYRPAPEATDGEPWYGHSNYTAASPEGGYELANAAAEEFSLTPGALVRLMRHRRRLGAGVWYAGPQETLVDERALWVVDRAGELALAPQVPRRLRKAIPPGEPLSWSSAWDDDRGGLAFDFVEAVPHARIVRPVVLALCAAADAAGVVATVEEALPGDARVREALDVARRWATWGKYPGLLRAWRDGASATAGELYVRREEGDEGGSAPVRAILLRAEAAAGAVSDLVNVCLAMSSTDRRTWSNQCLLELSEAGGDERTMRAAMRRHLPLGMVLLAYADIGGPAR